MALIKFIKGRKESTDLATLDSNTLYFFEDTHEFYKGQVRFGVGDLSAISSNLTKLEVTTDQLDEYVGELNITVPTLENSLT